MDNQARRAAFVNWPVLYGEMDRLGLDVLVASAPESTFYLAGCYMDSQLYVRERLALVVVPRNGEVSYLICNIEQALVESVSWIDDVRPYIMFVESPIELLAQVLEEKGLSHARVGIEEKFCSTEFYREIEQRLPRARLAGGDAAIGHARAVKMPAEIELLQEAARMSDEAAYAAWQRVRPGMTEHQVAIAMTQEMLARGAQKVAHISVGSGTNTHILRNTPGAKTLEAGDLFFGNFGVVNKGYWSDLTRMGVVGPPSQRQRDQYQRLREIQQAVIARMRPGVRCNALYEVARAELAKAGVDGMLPHLGHSMPRSRGHEPPLLQPHDETSLEPNMVLAVEPSFRSGPERYHLGDLVLVTGGEPRILSDRWDTTELFVFG